jgi:ribosomal protein S18 acetylase RimI-like enzyme
MSSSAVLIRRLEPDDAERLRTLRLESLRAFPAAFATATAEEEARSVDDFAAMLSDPEERAVFAAFVDGELVGMAGFAREAKAKMRHKALLWGVYVRPSCHGLGLGKALVEAVIAHARGRVVLLHACVSTTNEGARRTYFGLGFQSWGVERRALLVDGQWCDDDHIVLELG